MCELTIDSAGKRRNYALYRRFVHGRHSAMFWDVSLLASEGFRAPVRERLFASSAYGQSSYYPPPAPRLPRAPLPHLQGVAQAGSRRRRLGSRKRCRKSGIQRHHGTSLSETIIYIRGASGFATEKTWIIASLHKLPKTAKVLALVRVPSLVYHRHPSRRLMPCTQVASLDSRPKAPSP